MFGRLTGLVVELAARRWPTLLALAGQVASFRLLRWIGVRFAAATAGQEAFDFQNGLTVAEIEAQLPAYTAESRRLYRQFFVTDFFFPLIGSTFLALLWATLLGRRPDGLRLRLRQWHAPLWPFVPTLCDWGENVCFLLLIERHPRATPVAARLGVVMKRLKLGTLAATFVGTQALTLAAIVRGGRAWWRR